MPLDPVLTAHLFPKLDGLLIELLQSLSPYDWTRQTIAPKWKVKDVTAHLLDTALRRISMGRDGYRPELDPSGPFDVVAFVNRMNAEGVAWYARLSPQVLISLIELTSREMAAYFASLDPMAQASFGVSWAGEEKSLNWFDIAREFTERWHHQQQIRLATNKPGIMTKELYYPVLDCFMRALPFAYRSIPRPSESLLRANVIGESGGSWFLYRTDKSWQLVPGTTGNLIAEVDIPQEIAWRIFTKGIAREEASRQLTMRGDQTLAAHCLNVISIVG